MATRSTHIGLGTCPTLFLLLCLPYLFKANEIYRPEDLFTINCGSSDNFTSKGRSWTADSNTKLLLETQKGESSSSVAASVSEPTPIEDLYYSTARVSYSQFTYSFPVTTSGHKFIRLFFYPTSYRGFGDPTKAYFSVKSGNYTLLKDFNASLYTDSDDDTVFKEYCVYVQEGDHTLNVTFTPSAPKNHTNPYYAFINGIEVVSMPPYLYHTKPEDNMGLSLVGNTAVYPLENNSALETKYRFNVAGSELPALADTGMLRDWGADDGNYVTSQSGKAVDWGETKINFNMTREYTAPKELYTTLRHMGEDSAANLRFNLTWELPVDSDFTYMLRLHFCELDPGIHVPGERVFFIFVQDQVAENAADVLLWTNGQKGVPIYKDYAVFVPLPPGNKKSANISLKMSPRPKSPFADGVLDGLELFKISDLEGNLAGRNPDPRPKTPSAQQVPLQKKSSNKTPTGTIAGAVSGVALLLVVVVVVAAFFFIKRDSEKNNEDSKGYNGPKHKSDGSSKLPTSLCRRFSIEEIRTATNNFDELFLVGAGGFGDVYKGHIDNGETQVAVKRLKPGSRQGAHEFLNEIEMLSQLRHLHLVSLIGYCYERDEMILVYDYMTRGTLRDHLYNTDNPPLTWKQRVKLCIGAAHGLHYLHTGAKHVIIHRDVNSANILLNEKWVAKVSDFGLSRVGPIGTSMTHVSTVVKGSVGYLDPEYYKRQRLTEKSDVYSFGVVLLEVLCGRQPLLRDTEKEQVSLVDWATRCYHLGTLGEIVDPALKGDIAPECLSKFGELAMSCLLDDGTQRPSMIDIVRVLEFVLQLQENYIGIGVAVVVEGHGNYEDSDDKFSNNTSSRHVSDSSKSSGVSMTSTGDNNHASKETHGLISESVFSEIGDPKGQ